MAKQQPLNCLALACSPRRDGNTTLLAQKALTSLEQAGHQTKLLYLTDFNIKPCLACGGCDQTGVCIIKDDAAQVFEQILKAHVFILAAPIFSMGINAQAKEFIDRAQQYWAAKYLLGQQPTLPEGQVLPQGIFISCAGTKLPGVFDGATRVVKYFFKMLDIKLWQTFCYPGIDHQGEILQHQTALSEVGQLGQKLGEV